MIQRYKLLIFSLYLGLWTSLLWAQDPQIQATWVLKTDLSAATENYVARESITLQSNGTTGFHFKADGSKTFSAKIDPGLLFPPTPGTYADANGNLTPNPTIGAVVGSIPGQFVVSQTGGASYSIPIECPAGINGVQPNVALVYNSQGGSGNVGVGWQISGLSAVGKTVKNIFSDNAISGLNLSLKEKYTLDGNNLLALSGTYGADGTTYKTENKTYSIIQSLGQADNSNGTLTGTYPLSFKVITKDGQTIEYGSNNYQRIIPISSLTLKSPPLQWLISEVTDANGNFMTYSYVEEEGIIPTIKSITYGDISIEFDYDQKIVIPKSFIDGYYLLDKYLLRHIQVISKGTTIKQYDLSYNYDTQKEKSYLKDVTLTGQDNVKLNKTNIVWGTDRSIGAIAQASIPYPTYLASSFTNQHLVSMDIDGDGISDLIDIYPSGSTNYLSVFKGNYSQGAYKFTDNYLYGNLGPDFQINDVKGYHGGLLFCDFNANGKKTILVPKYYENKTANSHFVQYVDAFSGQCMTHILNTYSGMTAYASGDFNNDGKDELISFEKDYYQNRVGGNLPKAWLYYVNKSDLKKTELNADDIINNELTADDKIIKDPINFSGSIVNSDRTYTSGIPKEIFVADFDGDGLKDLMVTTEIGCFFLKNNGGVMGTDNIVHVSFSEMDNNIITDFNSTYSTIKCGDFNGDGLMDFIVNEHCNGNWKLAINNGRWGFDYYPLNNFTAVEESQTSKNDDKEDCIVTDFNHDGKSDVILVDPVYSGNNYVNTNISWYTSNGTGFNSPRTIKITDENYTFSKYNTTGDFDGDGKEDVLSYGSDLYNGLSKSDKLYIYSTFNTNSYPDNINSNFEANLVKSITDGMGIKTEVTYQPLTYYKTSDGSDFYTKGTGSVYPVADMSVPIYCVQNVKQPIDNVNISTTKYAYSGAKVQVTGKGFLGFNSQTVSNETNNAQSVSTTELEFPYCLPKTQTVVSSALTEGGEISRIVTTNTNTKGTDNVYVSLPSSSVETNSLNGISKTTNYTSYDPFGNLTGVEIIQGDLTITQTIGYGQFGSWAWCLNKPISNVTTKTLKGDTQVYTREKTYDYNTTSGNLTQEISDPSDTKNNVTTTYSEFDYGRPQTVKVETPGNAARISYVKYSGRFVENKTNYLGEKTDYDWGDKITGLLKSEKDYQGHITSYSYNGLGQLTETNFPNGIRKSDVLQWAASDNSFGAKYYSYSEISGSAPVLVWHDSYGRELVKQTYGLGGNTINVFTKYLDNGKVDRISEPTFVAKIDLVTADKWASIYNYDDPYGRVRSVSTPAGITHTDYYPIDRAILVTTPDGTDLKITNNTGQTESNMVNGKTVTYTYYPSGLTKTSTPEGGKTLTMYYDLQGNRTKLDDPDAGIVETYYNGFGELMWEKQIVHAKSQQVKTTNNYFDNGLLNNIVRENINTETSAVLHSETTSYIYDTEPNHTTRVKTITINDGNKQTFTYDDWDRVTNVEETVGTKVFNRQTVYDFFGRVKKDIYPSGYYTTNTYDNYGNLLEVNGAGLSIWKAIDENAKGQLLHASKGGKTSTYDFYDNGLPKEIKADGVMDMFYVFDGMNNLKSREDKLYTPTQKEEFGYDDLNRLTSWTVTHNSVKTPYTMTYDDLTDNLGNIQNKSGIETDPANLLTMSYGGIRADLTNIGPHTLSAISGVPANFPTADLNVTYTDFKKIATLDEGTKHYELTYGVDDERRMSVYYANGKSQEAPTLTRYYLGDYEEEIGANGKVRKIHYLSGAILIQNDGKADSLLYTYSDAQGSLIALTNDNGQIVRRYAYDPWGVRRDADNWNAKDSGANLIVNRGYTGHEHLDAFSIINMNGRVYDPLTAQFFSPDPYVQAPGNWVNYNRYTYCMNNPFKYTDKSGYWWGLDDLAAFAVGTIVGYVSYGLTTGNWGWKAVGAGLLSGVIADVGWNTMGAGVEGVKAMGLSASAVGHTATLAQAATAVFGANGLGYGTQVAVYTGLNSMAHKDQLKAADKKGWDGVAMMGAFTASSVLSYTLDPLSLKTSSTVQQFVGVVLTDNISDNMKDGELGLHTLHLGILGYDFDKKEAYSIFSKGLSGDQRWDMGYETVLGLSLFQDVRIDYRTPKCQCGIDYLGPLQSYYVRSSYIAKMANGILDTLDSYYMFTQNETAYQYWFNKKYNEDGTPNY